MQIVVQVVSCAWRWQLRKWTCRIHYCHYCRV